MQLIVHIVTLCLARVILAGRLSQRDSFPKFPYETSTTEFCTWWHDHEDPNETCDDVLALWEITMEQWNRWNPSVEQPCDYLNTEKSYCVEALNEPQITSSVGVTTTPAPTTTTSSTTTTSTSTKPWNGITTPAPYQPGMVDSCDKFSLVKSGENCESVAAQNGITLQQFLAWNTKVGGESCSGLWRDTYVCVSVIGHEPTPPKPDNGIETPSPLQPDVVNVCQKFHLVKPGESCTTVASINGISVEDFQAWNFRAGASCSSLWANTYACVSVITSYDFSRNIAGWDVIDGSYKVTEGSLVAASSNGGKALICARYSDFIVETDISLHASSGNAGLVFRASNALSGVDNYKGYYASIGIDNGGGYLLLGRADRNWNELGRMRLNIEANRKYQLAVHADADLIKVFVDDMTAPKLTATDNTYRQGLIGVRVYQVGATIDNFRVNPVVFDGFEKNMVGWSIADGGFDARSKILYAEEATSGKAVLDTTFFDFTLESDVYLLSSKGGNAGLMLRASSLGKGPDAYSGYYVGISAGASGSGGSVVLGRANGSWRSIQTVNGGIESFRYHRVKVVAVGDSIKVYVDDMKTPRIEARDSTYKGGNIGARVYGTSALYDFFKVVPNRQ